MYYRPKPESFCGQILAEIQGSGWTASPSCYFVVKNIFLNVHFQKRRGVPDCKSFLLCSVRFRLTLHGSTGNVRVPIYIHLPLIHKGSGLQITVTRAKSQGKKASLQWGRTGRKQERQWADQGGLYGGSALPWLVETMQEEGEGYWSCSPASDRSSLPWYKVLQ